MSAMSRFRAIAVIAGLVIFVVIMIAAMKELNDWAHPAGGQQHWSDVVDPH
jgi:uncharacterized membrane protein YjdF